MSGTPSPSVSSVGAAGKDCNSIVVGLFSGTTILVCVTGIGWVESPSSVLILITSTS